MYGHSIKRSVKEREPKEKTKRLVKIPNLHARGTLFQGLGYKAAGSVFYYVDYYECTESIYPHFQVILALACFCAPLVEC